MPNKEGRTLNAKNAAHLNAANDSIVEVSKRLATIAKASSEAAAHADLASSHLNAIGAQNDPDTELAISAARRKLTIAHLEFVHMETMSRGQTN